MLYNKLQGRSKKNLCLLFLRRRRLLLMRRFEHLYYAINFGRGKVTVWSPGHQEKE